MNPASELLPLYERFGYRQYKMSKFEEYGLYAENIDFLESNRIITFTDVSGKLMALKPDVTLSIIKNSKDSKDFVQKVYYHENVYRVQKGGNAFKEIGQIGLECIGDLDTYSIAEVVTLAAESLARISGDYVLDLSSLAVITGALARLQVPRDAMAQAVHCIGEKNRHELRRILTENGVASENIAVLEQLILLYGKPENVIPALRALPEEVIAGSDIDALAYVLDALEPSVLSHINIDFSVVSDTAYYNDIVFKGFVNGIPAAILSGGQYGSLMKRMGRNARAIGFAVYLDLLERFNETPRRYDCDVLLLYNKEDSPFTVAQAVRKLSENYTVNAERSIPPEYRYRKLMKLENGEVITVEDNA